MRHIKQFLACLIAYCVLLTPAYSTGTIVGHTVAQGLSSVTTTGYDDTGADYIYLWTSSIGYIGFNTVTPTDSYTGCSSPCNTWSAHDVAAVTNSNIEAWTCTKPCKVGPNHVFSISSSNMFATFGAISICGTAASSPYDAESNGTTTGSSVTAANLTPANNNSIVIVTGANGSASSTFSANGGVSQIDQLTTSAGVAIGGYSGYIVQGTASAIGTTLTLSSGSALLTVGQTSLAPGTACTSTVSHNFFPASIP